MLRTTPVLLCAAKYYSSTTRTTKYFSRTTLYYSTTPLSVLQSTTLYYKVPVQHYSVLQNYCCKLQSTTPVLQSTTAYWKVLHEMSLTLRGATGVHCPFSPSILCLRRRMILMMNPRCIGNVIHNAWSNRYQPPTSPNTVPATQH